MTVLVVAAHPDDELLGCGGTLARHVLEGEEVHALVMSEGASSRYEDGMADSLVSAAGDAGKHLGLAAVEFGWFPDQRLDTVPILELTQHIEEVVTRLRPTILYTHFPGDVNADHGIVARAAWTACRPYVVPGLRRFAVYETPSSTEWGWPLGSPVFEPDHFVNITDTLEQKLAAMSCYESELRSYPHPRSLQALRERAAYWGSHVGFRAAEAFRILREVTP